MEMENLFVKIIIMQVEMNKNILKAKKFILKKTLIQSIIKDKFLIILEFLKIQVMYFIYYN